MTSETRPAVLIIDDDPGIRELLRTLAERRGCAVVTAANGIEAIEKLKDADFDLLVLDLMMPIMNGYDVVDQLKMMTTGNRPAVIVVTAGHEDARSMDRLDGRVVSSIVRKPFDIGAVSDFIQVTAAAVHDARAA
ncbi:MAG TPA: response regulator [Thermoanaerobaculia bacterium]